MRHVRKSDDEEAEEIVSDPLEGVSVWLLVLLGVAVLAMWCMTP